MEIKDLDSLGLPKKIEKSHSEEVQSKKVSKNNQVTKKEFANASSINQSDQVEISEVAKAFQKSNDELKVAKELLAKLPTIRAHVIYAALAKLKAGLYSSEQIIAEAAEKLVKSGELNDLIEL